jgi:hypothetical protein
MARGYVPVPEGAFNLAPRHGRSVGAEPREILAEAVPKPADSLGLFTTLLDRFGALDGADLDLHGREESAPPAEFSRPRLASPRSTRKPCLGTMRDRPASLEP